MLESIITKYVWVTNGGCEACNELDGQEFDSIDDIPDKPHPGCQCSVKEVEDEPCDCAELLDELSEIVGDANCLQDELGNMIAELSNQDDFFKSAAQSVLDDMENWDNAVGDFARNYNDMVEANTIGADKYFHSKANCEAAQRGFDGEVVSRALSIYRELEEGSRKVLFEGKDLIEQIEDAKRDMKANDYGREQGKKYPDNNPGDLVKKYRPNGLDPKY